MAGYRRRGGVARATKRARQAARHRDEFESKLASATSPGQRVAAGYAYVLAGLAASTRRGRGGSPVVRRQVEDLVAQLGRCGDVLFDPGHAAGNSERGR